MPQTAILKRPKAGDVLGFEVPFLSAGVGLAGAALTMVLLTRILHCDYQPVPSGGGGTYISQSRTRPQLSPARKTWYPDVVQLASDQRLGQSHYHSQRA